MALVNELEARFLTSIVMDAMGWFIINIGFIWKDVETSFYKHLEAIKGVYATSRMINEMKVLALLNS